MIAAKSITTADQLWSAGDIGRCELVRGELVMMSPSGFPHGVLTARLAKLLSNYVDARANGVVLGAETGFRISRDPDTVRAPDVSFISAERAKLAPKRGYFPGAPDLAVEVLSPDDGAGNVLDKVSQYLAAGTTAVWIVDPDRKTLAVHRNDQPVRVFGISEVVADEGLLPGLRLPVADIFA